MKQITVSKNGAWSESQAHEYLREAAGPDADVDRGTSTDGELLVVWKGSNRREVFAELLRNGWAITSVDGQDSGRVYVWIEQVL